MSTGERRACDVCIINSNDHTPKDGVVWCGSCEKWRCPTCRGSIPRKAAAITKHYTGIDITGLLGIESIEVTEKPKYRTRVKNKP